MTNQTIQQFRKFIALSLDSTKIAALWCNQHGDLHVTHSHSKPQGGECWQCLATVQAGTIDYILN